MAGNGGKREGAGRPKGAKDKISRDLKAFVLETVERLDAEGKSLYSEAEKDPKWFYANFVKPMLPKDVTLAGDPDKPLGTATVFNFLPVGSDASKPD